MADTASLMRSRVSVMNVGSRPVVPKAAMRGRDGSDAVDRPDVVEHHAAAAIHLRVDEARARAILRPARAGCLASSSPSRGTSTMRPSFDDHGLTFDNPRSVEDPGAGERDAHHTVSVTFEKPRRIVGIATARMRDGVDQRIKALNHRDGRKDRMNVFGCGQHDGGWPFRGARDDDRDAVAVETCHQIIDAAQGFVALAENENWKTIPGERPGPVHELGRTHRFGVDAGGLLQFQRGFLRHRETNAASDDETDCSRLDKSGRAADQSVAAACSSASGNRSRADRRSLSCDQ